MGDSVEFSEGQTVDIAITGLVPGSLVKVFTISSVYLEQEATSSRIDLHLAIQSDMGLVRVEIWSPEGGIIAFSNPLHIL